jgi:plasmid stabilization system protein ParE
VADCRLSERAERDLIEIYDYTDETFGAYQAEAYHAGLERTFDLPANFPLIGRLTDEIVPGLRRFRIQVLIGRQASRTTPIAPFALASTGNTAAGPAELTSAL